MKKILIAASLMLATAAFAQRATVAPGVRSIMLAHNAYPDHGNYEDRLDRALSSGEPFAVEEDLAWTDGQSLLIHGAKACIGRRPYSSVLLLSKVRPVIEKALKEGNRGNWPLITLYLDIKNDPPEHLEAVAKLLDQYESWLTTTVKTDDILTVSPLDVKPMMVLVEDKQNDINKQQIFYDRVQVGGKIRVFGSVPKLDPNPGHQLPKDEAVNRQFLVQRYDLIQGKADNYHRWIGFDWAYIEKGGESHAGAWTEDSEQRLKDFVAYGHKLGYLVGFYCLDGFTQAEDQGWDAEYTFGSHDAAFARWNAVMHAKADFISTDQYEQLASAIASSARLATTKR